MVIKDNERNDKEDFLEIKGLVNCILNKSMGKLEEEGVFVLPDALSYSKDITREQMILQSINGKYCSGNVMGFLGYGDERLIIESRFCSEEDYLFRYLLENVLEYPNVVDYITDSTSNDWMFSLLILLFPTYLANAMRKGIFKQYVENEYNNANVRGRIDVNRQIQKNTPFIGNVAYSQREFTYDNSLMQLIRHTVEFIKRKPYGDQLLSKVKTEVNMVIEVTPSYEAKNLSRVLAVNKKRTVRHAFFHEYQSLQKLCIMILLNERTQVGLGIRKINGILFDGTWLWEEYIFSLISKEKMFYHPRNKAHEGKQYLFDSRSGEIYPDFIGADKDNRIIADAKYKPIKNIRSGDYLQVLAYMYRFDAKKGYFFYPEVDTKDDETLWLNSGCSYEKNVTRRNDICLIKHGLRIPQNASSYEEFVEKIQENENKFLSEFLIV